MNIITKNNLMSKHTLFESAYCRMSAVYCIYVPLICKNSSLTAIIFKSRKDIAIFLPELVTKIALIIRDRKSKFKGESFEV